MLEKTGGPVQARVMMYKAMTLSVPLYGSERWMVTGVMLKVLEGFHHQAARQIIGMMATCGAGGEWKYPPVVA